MHAYRTDVSKPGLFKMDYPYWDWFFPGVFEESRAEAVKLTAAETIRNADFKMPPFPVERTVSGTIILEDGTPVKDVPIYYRVKGKEESSRQYAPIKDDGSFSFQIYEEFEYEVLAANYDVKSDKRFSSERYVINRENFKDRIKLVLKPEK